MPLMRRRRSSCRFGCGVLFLSTRVIVTRGDGVRRRIARTQRHRRDTIRTQADAAKIEAAEKKLAEQEV